MANGLIKPIKLRGRTRLRLIQELALGVRTQADLAADLDITQQAVHYYASRYAAEIDAQRTEIENSFSALWIADKAARIAELQDDVERITEELDTVSDADRAKLYSAKRAALRCVAEELGQLAPKTINATVSVRYSVDGVDTGELK